MGDVFELSGDFRHSHIYIKSSVMSAGTTGGVPYQPPRPVAEFVGRFDELALLDELLVPGQRVGITGLVGMGGLGKTELAKVAADRAAERFRDGVLWADCRVQGSGTVADLWATAYGVQLKGADDASKLAEWRSLGCQKEALLVFDDVQPKQNIEPLIPPRGRCAVLVTTRYGGHAALQGAVRLDLETFTARDAAALVDEVLGVGTAVEQADEAENLVELTGFLPLALDVALHLAKRRRWDLAALNREIEAKGALRTLGDEERLNKSLWAMLEAAWGSLPAELAEVFQLLPIFKGGASFDTAAMAAVIDRDEMAAGERLHRLAGRSLAMEVGEGRWRVHPLVQTFAETRGGVDDRVWVRMTRHYKGVLRAANLLYVLGGGWAWMGLTLFDMEQGHIELGQRWAATRSGQNDEAAQLCVSYPDTGMNVLNLRLRMSEWIGWLEAAIASAKRLEDRGAEARHLGNLGAAHQKLKDAIRAIPYHEQALAIMREIGDRKGEASALGNLGLAYSDLGDSQRAIQYLNQSLEISREIGDRQMEGSVLGNLGIVHRRLGETMSAISFYEQSLGVSHEIDDVTGAVAAIGNLGHAYAESGDKRRAISVLELALEMNRETDDMWAEAQLLGSIGNTYADLGEVQHAISLFERAVEICCEIGDRRGQRDRLVNLGSAYQELGSAQQAGEYYEQALVISREIGDRQEEGKCFGLLALVHEDLGDVHQVVSFYEKGLEVSREIGDRRGEGMFLSALGTAHRDLGNVQRAKECLTEALGILENIEEALADPVQRALALLSTDGEV